MGKESGARMTTRKPAIKSRKKAKDPGHEVREVLKDMDFWVNSAYLLTPLLLGSLWGWQMLGLTLFIYPLISLIYFIVRHRYLKSLSREQRSQVYPYSHIYIGRGISMLILIGAVMSGGMALYEACC